MRLRITQFSGEIPKVHRTLLPEGFAQQSINADHGGRVIDPFHQNTVANTPGGSFADFYLHKGQTWLTFSQDTDVVPGPVASDRLYISREGAAPLLKIMPDGTEYPLALPIPAAPPTIALETDTTVPPPPGSQAPYSTSLTTTEFVTAVYQDILGRDPDPGGLVFWRDHLDAENVTRAEFIAEIERQEPSLPQQPPSEDVVYVYTWVSIFDEESLPSPPSGSLTVPEGSTVRVTFIDQPPSGTRINRLRVYRTQTSGMGVTEYHFVKELNAATTDYVHDVDVDLLQEILPSTFYHPPSDNLRGLTSMPNGMIAGFDGKTLHFCEPYKPHAWPRQYELVTDYDIVALVAFGTMLAILTTGTPYIVQGTAPENMIMERIELNAPCVSRDGVVDLGYAAAYPSTEGLVTLSQQGGSVVTQNLFSRAQWQEMNPETFSAGHRMGSYIFTYEDDFGTRKTAIIDLTGQNPALTRSSTVAQRIRQDIYTGKLHFMESGKIWEFSDESAPRLSATWQSGEYLLPTITGFGVLLIEGDELDSNPPDILATVYADGVVFATVDVMNEPARLPHGLATRWSVRTQGRSLVSRITMAGSVEEIF